MGKQRNGWDVNRKQMKLETENEKPQILQSTFQWSSKNRSCSVKRNEWKKRLKIDQIEMGQVKYNKKYKS